MPTAGRVGRRPAPLARRRAVDSDQSHYSRPNAYARVAQATGLDPAVVRDLWLSERSTSARRKKLSPYDLTAAHIKALDMLRMSEDQLGAQIVRWIKVANSVHPLVDGEPRFLYYHTYNSMRSPSGWPDMTLLDRALWWLYVWEEKREDGEPTGIQTLWLEGLKKVTDAGRSSSVPSVTVLEVIRPSNAETLLKRILDL